MKQTEVAGVIDTLIQAGLAQQREVDQRRPTVDITALGKRVMMATDPLPDTLKMSYPLARKLAAVSRGIESGDVQSHKTAVDANPSDEQQDSSRVQSGSTTAAEASSGARDEPSIVCRELTERLKRWRRRQSAAMGIPAYRVLTNATIDRIAELMPRNSEQLEIISGVGPATIEQFGHDIVELVLSAFSDEADEVDDSTASPLHRKQTLRNDPDPNLPDSERRLPERDREQSVLPQADDSTDRLPETAEGTREVTPGRDAVDTTDAYWTWRLFRDGYTASQIAQIRRCDEAVLQEHLVIAAGMGHPVEAPWCSSEEVIRRIREATPASPS